jgi:hypothetical protein
MRGEECVDGLVPGHLCSSAGRFCRVGLLSSETSGVFAAQFNPVRIVLTAKQSTLEA